MNFFTLIPRFSSKLLGKAQTVEASLGTLNAIVSSLQTVSDAHADIVAKETAAAVEAERKRVAAEKEVADAAVALQNIRALLGK
jgi:hypothetical protein